MPKIVPARDYVVNFLRKVMSDTKISPTNRMLAQNRLSTIFAREYEGKHWAYDDKSPQKTDPKDVKEVPEPIEPVETSLDKRINEMMARENLGGGK